MIFFAFFALLTLSLSDARRLNYTRENNQSRPVGPVSPVNQSGPVKVVGWGGSNYSQFGGDWGGANQTFDGRRAKRWLQNLWDGASGFIKNAFGSEDGMKAATNAVKGVIGEPGMKAATDAVKGMIGEPAMNAATNAIKGMVGKQDAGNPVAAAAKAATGAGDGVSSAVNALKGAGGMPGAGGPANAIKSAITAAKGAKAVRGIGSNAAMIPGRE